MKTVKDLNLKDPHEDIGGCFESCIVERITVRKDITNLQEQFKDMKKIYEITRNINESIIKNGMETTNIFDKLSNNMNSISNSNNKMVENQEKFDKRIDILEISDEVHKSNLSLVKWLLTGVAIPLYGMLIFFYTSISINNDKITTLVEKTKNIEGNIVTLKTIKEIK